MLYNKSADGIRGLAALVVVISHFLAAYYPSILSVFYPETFVASGDPSYIEIIFQYPLLSTLYNSRLAVLIFFVLSGYVLAMPYYNGQIIKIQKRLWSRYIRLNLPIAASICLSLLIMQAGMYSNLEAASLSNSVWFGKYFLEEISFSGFAHDLIYNSIVNGSNGFNPPLWSLGIEFIGSLLLLSYYLAKPTRNDMLSFLLVVVFLFFIFKESSIYYILFFIGSLMRKVYFSPVKLRFIFFLGLFFGGYSENITIYQYFPSVKIWDDYVFYSSIGATLIVFSCINNLGSDFLLLKWVQFLGKISYSLYLIHFLLLSSLSSFLYIKLPKEFEYLCLNFFIYVFCSVMLSYVFYKAIDIPSITVARKFSNYMWYGR